MVCLWVPVWLVWGFQKLLMCWNFPHKTTSTVYREWFEKEEIFSECPFSPFLLYMETLHAYISKPLSCWHQTETRNWNLKTLLLTKMKCEYQQNRLKATQCMCDANSHELAYWNNQTWRSQPCLQKLGGCSSCWPAQSQMQQVVCHIPVKTKRWYMKLKQGTWDYTIIVHVRQETTLQFTVMSRLELPEGGGGIAHLNQAPGASPVAFGNIVERRDETEDVIAVITAVA